MEIDINNPSQNIPIPEANQDLDIPTVNLEPDSTADSYDMAPRGLSREEYTDPNSISVTVADQQTPIVVLFGPPACGKTMTLIRLTRYLKTAGYTVQPIRSFRPAADSHYSDLCTEFDRLVASNNAADSTDKISFMLVKVVNQVGKTICQILEAPGEYYYHPENPNADFPSYVYGIKNSNNRKIWCFMLEPDWLDAPDRMGYVNKIHRLKREMRISDKAIFVYNKVDKTPYVISPGRINEKEARRDVENQYSALFVPFRAKKLFGGFFDKFSFVGFKTGDYPKTFDGSKTFVQGENEYPEHLWKEILKYIHG